MSFMKSLRFAFKICFGTEVRFFFTMTYFIIIFTLAWNL